MRAHGVEVLTVDDAATVAAMRLLWTRTKQLVEPSSAIALAAMLQHRERFAGQRIGVVLSGGNVDLDALPALREHGGKDASTVLGCGCSWRVAAGVALHAAGNATGGPRIIKLGAADLRFAVSPDGDCQALPIRDRG